jgi:hypothetical protein
MLLQNSSLNGMNTLMRTLRILVLALLSACASSAAVFIVTNTADSGAGSLRSCITSANNLAGADDIQFNLPGSGVRTIFPDTPLPDITSPVTIDGYTQPGSHANTLDWDNDAQLLVRLDGLQLTNGLPYALTLKASGCVVRGLIVVRFPSGIRIDNASNVIIAGNWIGLDWDGVARGMTFEGISIYGSSTFNVIGGSSPADRNVVSGNNQGITIFPTSASNNSVINNFVGTDARGRLPRGNIFNGVFIQSANNIHVLRNVLCSSTSGSGLGILGGSGHVIQNNLIGLGAAAWTGLGNSGDGISVNGGSNLTIGGTNAGNFIGLNRGHGIFLLGGSGSSVTHNRIGTASGGFEPFGNTGSGVCLQGSGTNRVACNQILFNGDAGVKALPGSYETANEITANQIYDNAGLGIDLGGDSVTLNDPGDNDVGPNELQNYPALETATLGGSGLVVAGFLDSHSSTMFRLDFYASDSWDPLWIPEGRVFLGSKAVTTDGLGTASFQFTGSIQAWASDMMITATATDPMGNTSEFSLGVPVVLQPAPPSLLLVRTGSELTVCWPMAAIGFDLETASSLEPTESWTTVTTGIQQTATNFCYPVPDVSLKPSQCFRLKKR